MASTGPEIVALVAEQFGQRPKRLAPAALERLAAYAEPLVPAPSVSTFPPAREDLAFVLFDEILSPVESSSWGAIKALYR